jgi:nucleotide-binding universal stress UspA family protein/CBS domain-containing protein
MPAHTKPLLALTAGDLMTGPVEVIHQRTTLPEAARLLLHARVSGAPVVDDEGRCVGVLSATDLARWVESSQTGGRPESSQVQTCRYLDGEHCTLPVGACPIQGVGRPTGGNEAPVCRMPHCVFSDWQVVIEALPAQEVLRYMTADPVLISPETPLAKVARMMVDAQIHRLIVVDPERRPVGVVSGTDVVAAVARFAAHPHQAGAPARTILCPTDFSEAASAAFPVACSLARGRGARVVLLHVYPPPLCHGEVVARRQPDRYEDDLWRLLGGYQSSAPDVHVEPRLVEGDAIKEILRQAGEEGCDLIVLGTQGRTGLARLLLGSVAEQVLRQAPCPVLTVRPSTAGGAEASRATAEKPGEVACPLS